MEEDEEEQKTALLLSLCVRGKVVVFETEQKEELGDMFVRWCFVVTKQKGRKDFGKIFNTTAKGTIRHTSLQFKWRRVLHRTLQLRLVCVRIYELNN